jgi:hypothetical protein
MDLGFFIASSLSSRCASRGFSSRSWCASFLVAAQSDPRRGASCYCGYLSPADLASLSPGSGQSRNLCLHLLHQQPLLAEQGFLLLDSFITLCH